jgi:hypothetical protein
MANLRVQMHAYTLFCSVLFCSRLFCSVGSSVVSCHICQIESHHPQTPSAPEGEGAAP